MEEYLKSIEEKNVELQKTMQEVEAWKHERESLGLSDPLEADGVKLLQDLKEKIDKNVTSDFTSGFLADYVKDVKQKNNDIEKHKGVKTIAVVSLSADALAEQDENNIKNTNITYAEDVTDVVNDKNSSYNQRLYDAEVGAGEAFAGALVSMMEANLNTVCDDTPSIVSKLGFSSKADFVKKIIRSNPVFDGLYGSLEKWKDEAKVEYRKGMVDLYQAVVTGKGNSVLSDSEAKLFNDIYISQVRTPESNPEVKIQAEKALRDIYKQTIVGYLEKNITVDSKKDAFEYATGLKEDDSRFNVTEMTKLEQLKQAQIDDYFESKFKEEVLTQINADVRNEGFSDKKKARLSKRQREIFEIDPEFVRSVVYNIGKVNGKSTEEVTQFVIDESGKNNNGSFTAEEWKELGKKLAGKIYEEQRAENQLVVSTKHFSVFDNYVNEHFYEKSQYRNDLEKQLDQENYEKYVNDVFDKVVVPSIGQYGRLQSAIINSFAKAGEVVSDNKMYETFKGVNSGVNVAPAILDYDDACTKFTFAQIFGEDFAENLDEYVKGVDGQTVSDSAKGIIGAISRLKVAMGQKQETTPELLENKSVREQALIYLNEVVEKEKVNKLVSVCVESAKTAGAENKVEFAQQMYNELVEKLKEKCKAEISAYNILESSENSPISKEVIAENKQNCRRIYLVDKAIITADMFAEPVKEEEVKADEPIIEPVEKGPVKDPSPEPPVNEHVVEPAKEVNPTEPVKAGEGADVAETVKETPNTNGPRKDFKNLNEYLEYFVTCCEKCVEGKKYRPKFTVFNDLLNEDNINIATELIIKQTPYNLNEEQKNNFVMWFDNSVEKQEEIVNYLSSTSRTELFDSNATEEQKQRHVLAETQFRIVENAKKLVTEKNSVGDTTLESAFGIADLSDEEKAKVVFDTQCQMKAKGVLTSIAVQVGKRLPLPSLKTPTPKHSTKACYSNCINTTFSSAEAQEKYFKIILDALNTSTPKNIFDKYNENKVEKEESKPEIVKRVEKPHEMEKESERHESPKPSVDEEESVKKPKPAEPAKEEGEKKASREEMNKFYDIKLAGADIPLGIRDMAIDALWLDLYDQINDLPDSYKKYIGQNTLDVVQLASLGEESFGDDKERIARANETAHDMYEKIERNKIIRSLIAESGKSSEYKMLTTIKARKEWVVENIINKKEDRKDSYANEYEARFATMKDEVNKMFEIDKAEKRGAQTRKDVARSIVQIMTNGSSNVSDIALAEDSVEPWCQNSRLYNAAIRAGFSFDLDDYVEKIKQTVNNTNKEFKYDKVDPLKTSDVKKWKPDKLSYISEKEDAAKDDGNIYSTVIDGVKLYCDVKTDDGTMKDNDPKVTIVDISIKDKRERTEFVRNVVDSMNAEKIYEAKNLWSV